MPQEPSHRIPIIDDVYDFVTTPTRIAVQAANKAISVTKHAGQAVSDGAVWFFTGKKPEHADPTKQPMLAALEAGANPEELAQKALKEIAADRLPEQTLTSVDPLTGVHYSKIVHGRKEATRFWRATDKIISEEAALAGQRVKFSSPDENMNGGFIARASRGLAGRRAPMTTDHPAEIKDKTGNFVTAKLVEPHAALGLAALVARRPGNHLAH